MTVVVVITEVNKSDNYQIGKEHRKFETLQEAKNFIKTESEGHTLRKVYQDKKDGSSFQVGYVWSYWDQYYGEKGKFLHEIWTTFLNEEITSINLGKL